MKKLVVLPLTFLAIVACSKGNNNDPIGNFNATVADKDLQGKDFTGQCNPAVGSAVQTIGTIKTQQEVFLIQGENLTHSIRYFESLDCSGDADYVLLEKATVVPNKKQGNANTGYYIDIHYTSFWVNISTDAGAAAANKGKLCGATNWAKGSDTEETGNAKDLDCYNTPLPRDIFNVYRVDNGTLYFGDVQGTTNLANARPNQLDMNNKYISK